MLSALARGRYSKANTFLQQTCYVLFHPEGFVAFKKQRH